MKTLPKHPSGRPIRRNVRRDFSIPRVPYDEPLTPGLRHHRRDLNLIGFHHHVAADSDDDLDRKS